MSNLVGKIYDIQGFSVQDGPGIRTTVFLKGCPLRCPWCHSPESQNFQSQLSWMKMRCIGVDLCGACIPACPQQAIKPGKRVLSENGQGQKQLVEVNRDRCIDCGACTNVCSPEALSICGKDYTVEEVLERVAKDWAFYEKSGGGITISGGEAMSQPQFTLELLKAATKANIHTALDTSGYAKWEDIEKVLPYTNLFLFDLKHMENSMHKTVIGLPNQIILENLKKIAERGGTLQIRIPFIPMFNDSDENIQKTGEFCKSLGGAVALVQLLPYHALGIAKYERILWQKPIFHAMPPKDSAVQHAKETLERMGLLVTVH